MAGQQRITGIFPQLGPLGKDCQNTTNAACDISAKNGCEVRYYPDGCNTKVTPSWANAITSEIANVIKDSGAVYDCSKLDNLSQAIQQRIEDSLYGCLTREFPKAENSCSVIPLALATTSDGCLRIVQNSPDDSLIANSSYKDFYPAGTKINIPNTRYSVTDLVRDIRSGVVDRTRMALSMCGRLIVDLQCPTTATLHVEQTTLNKYIDGTDLAVVAINGSVSLFPETDMPFSLGNPLSNGGGYSNSLVLSLPQGNNTIEVFYASFTDGGATIPVETTSPSGLSITGRVWLTRGYS